MGVRYALVKDKTFVGPAPYNIVHSQEVACLWKKKESAEHVLASLKKRKKNPISGFTVLEINVEDPIAQKKKEKPDKNDAVAKESAKPNPEQKPCDMTQINMYLEAIRRLVDTNPFEYLNNKLSALDKQLIDLEHKIEFSDFDACSGYKYAKLMQNVRRERREVKDCIFRLQVIKADNIMDIAKLLIETDKQLESRTYAPRSDFNLF